VRQTARAGDVSVTIDPRGARIASLRWGERELLLAVPGADDDGPSFDEPGGSAEFHRRYRGGWDVLLPNAGEARTIGGVRHPFHGEAAWRRWTLRAEPRSVLADVVLRTAPLVVRRRVQIDEGGLSVSTEVRNTGAETARFTHAEHPAWSSLLLGDAATLVVGGHPVAFDAREGVSLFRDLPVEAGRYELRERPGGWGVGLSWDASVFPRLWVWQEHRATTGFPWWGSVDTAGIEPAARRYDDGMPPLSLSSGDSMTTTIRVDLLPGA